MERADWWAFCERHQRALAVMPTFSEFLAGQLTWIAPK